MMIHLGLAALAGYFGILAAAIAGKALLVVFEECPESFLIFAGLVVLWLAVG